MTSADTSQTRNVSSFGKVIASGIAAKLSILAIFLGSKFG
tara:strand:- start:1 stop:120 length:120 start_codon:yes stop_codon:yes gene_type:complete